VSRHHHTLGFDIVGFIAEFESVARKFGMKPSAAAVEAGVNRFIWSTMRRRGTLPTAPVLAALCAWSGIQPGRFAYTKLPPGAEVPADA
jgi:hypothetical protein